MARSTFYYHLNKLKLVDKYLVEKELINEIYHQNQGRYGYRRISLELKNRGYNLNHKTVFRLMNLMGIKSIVRTKRYRSYKSTTSSAAPNVLERNFTVNQPNRKWVTDVTEFLLFGTRIYLSPILDLYNSEIISYSISKHPSMDMVNDMLDKAFSKKLNLDGLILHSDQGWQYHHKYYQHVLSKRGITQSMSRKGNCLDNAVIENFFGLLKSELLYLQKFDSVIHFINELNKYIHYYNNDRIKAKLNGMSPVQYRAQCDK